jgi:3-oxoacyl-[acyl-carrier-protein] synthase III
MSDDLLNKGQRDRGHIAMGQPHEVQYWTRHLGVSRDALQRTVDKVGNSAAAVRKELGLMGEPHK